MGCFFFFINLQIFYNIFKNDEKNLIIDTDASSGFWEIMGLINVPKNTHDDREGYEKFISHRKIKDEMPEKIMTMYT